MSAIRGTLVTERFEYDGGRDVTVYVPPEPPEAVVFAGDGQLISSWGESLEAVDVPPTSGSSSRTSVAGCDRASGSRCPPRMYLVAGTMEPFFHENATRWATALRDAGGDVVMTERVGAHGDAFWREEFPLMAAWAFR